jgi:type III pantothenate kinase
MRLLVDVGNSRTKFLFEKQNKLTEIKYIGNDAVNAQWLTDTFINVESITLASVNHNSLTEIFSSFSEKQNISFIQVKSEGERFGVTSIYQQPTTLGVDRWLTLLATAALYKNKNVLIIDAGTATTADLLDNNANHVGGWILPGINTLFSSLLVNTTHVSATQSPVSAIAFGQNTSECVNQACWAATIGFIEQAIIQAKKLMTLDNILVTGGNAEGISKLLVEDHKVINKLVFLGMQRFNEVST